MPEPTIEVKLQLPLQLALDIGHLADDEAMKASEWIVRHLQQAIDPATGKPR